MQTADARRDDDHGGFDPARIADPRFVRVNRRPAHSDHRWFRSAAEAAEGVSDCS